MRLLLADDHKLMLEGVRRTLESCEDIEIVGEAHSGSQVLPLVARTRADAVLLDVRMPGMDGLTCLDRLRERHPQVKVVVLSVFADSEHVQSALRRGATGYISKSINPTELPSALREALLGTVDHALGLPDEGEDGAGKDLGLTDREIVILRAVARGLSNQAIARELWVTEQTVKFHLTNIYRKLGVANRTEAARCAYERGVIPSPLVEYA